LRARDDVMGIVAHDLRNPITAAKLATETLLMDLDADPATARRLDTILRALGRANHLIQDLLDVARIEAGQALGPARAAGGGAAGLGRGRGAEAGGGVGVAGAGR